MFINAPDNVYANYPAKPLDISFADDRFASDVTFEVNNPSVFVENGKIYAKGTFDKEVTVTVKATSKYSSTEFTVKVSTFNKNSAETKVQYYEEHIIKPENKGGTIFVGDSYFDGYKMDALPFWKDFYADNASDEKFFLMGISSAQIDTLEIVSERIVYPMEPSEIVVHIGFNDVHHGPLTVDALYARIIALCEQYKERLPQVTVYFMGVEPKKNGYTAGTQYYESSTFKAAALTEKMIEYAEKTDWFVYLDTMPIFVNSDGTINQSSYLSTDLSHPTLDAYDRIREVFREARRKNKSN
jgi:lysophospholipase L1-like esterase